MPRKVDITGHVFGMLTVEGDSGLRNKAREKLWRCSCECGNYTNARAIDLRNGDYKSCGCRKGENIAKAKTTHNMSRSEEYSIWDGMIQRCTNQNSENYENYGGRGITVCERWQESFENFLEDMGYRPSKDFSIDRKDNNKGYSPDNCRWATASEQAFNRRKQRGCTSRAINVYYNKRAGKWIARTYDGKVRTYIGSFDTEEEAIRALGSL